MYLSNFDKSARATLECKSLLKNLAADKYDINHIGLVLRFLEQDEKV